MGLFDDLKSGTQTTTPSTTGTSKTGLFDDLLGIEPAPKTTPKATAQTFTKTNYPAVFNPPDKTDVFEATDLKQNADGSFSIIGAKSGHVYGTEQDHGTAFSKQREMIAANQPFVSFGDSYPLAPPTAKESAKEAIKSTGKFLKEDIIGIPSDLEKFEKEKPGVLGWGAGMAQFGLTATVGTGIQAFESAKTALTGKDYVGTTKASVPVFGDITYPEFTSEGGNAFIRTMDRILATPLPGVPTIGLKNPLQTFIKGSTQKPFSDLLNVPIENTSTLRDALTLMGEEAVLRPLYGLDIAEIGLVTKSSHAILQTLENIPDREVIRLGEIIARDIPAVIDDVAEYTARQIDETRLRGLVREGAEEFPKGAIDTFEPKANLFEDLKPPRGLLDEVEIPRGAVTPEEEILRAAERLFEVPESELRLISEGLTPQQARDEFARALRLEREIADNQAKAAAARQEALDLATSQANAAKTEAAERVTRAIKEEFPTTVSTVESTLSSVVSRVPTTIRRILQAADGALEERLAPILESVSDTVTIADTVTKEEIDAAVTKARQTIDDYTAEYDVIPEELTTNIEEVNKNLQLLDTAGTRISDLQAQLTDNGLSNLRRELSARELNRMTAQIEKANKGKVQKLNERADTLTQKATAGQKELQALKASPTYVALQKGIAAGYKATQLISPRGVQLTKEQIETLGNLKDLGPLESGEFSMLDAIRAAEVQQGGTEGVLTDLIIEPVAIAKANSRVQSDNELEIITEQLRKALPNYGKYQVIRKLTFGLVKFKKRTTRMFDYGETAMTAADATQLGLTKQEKQFMDLTRKVYDIKLDQINEVRRALNLPEVKKRKNYMPHIREMSLANSLGLNIDFKDGFAAFDNLMVDAAQDEKTLSKIAFQFEKLRKGDPDFNKDPISAIFAYLPAANDQIHMARPAADIKAIIPHLPKRSQYYWTKRLNERLLGMPDYLDRMVDRATMNIGVSNVLGGFSKRYARGTLVGSANFLVQQPTTVIQTMVRGGFRNSYSAAIANMTPEGRAFARKYSRFGKTRQSEQLLPGTGVLSRVNYLADKVDRELYYHSFLTFYKDGINEGLTHKAAATWADNMAAKTQVIYDPFFSPFITGSKVGRTAAPFQTFPINMYNMFRRDLPMIAKERGKMAAVGVGMLLYASMQTTNTIYEALGLYAPFDFVEKGQRLSFIPVFGSSYLSFGPPPAVKVVQIAMTLGNPNSGKKSKEYALNELKKIAPAIASTGGKPLMRAAEGLSAIHRGYIELGRDKERVMLDTTMKQIMTLLFGRTGTKEAKEIIESWKQDSEGAAK